MTASRGKLFQRSCAERLVVAKVVLRHPPGRETLLEARAHLVAVELAEAADRLDRLGFSIDDEACDALVDHLRDGAAAEGDDRRAARHGLDHDQTERLGPVDR